MSGLYRPVECAICPRKADGERTTHVWATERWRRHIELSTIVSGGYLEAGWWMLSLRERLKLVEVVERDTGADLSELRQLIKSDGPSRNFAYRYAMTGGKSQVDRIEGYTPAIADELAEWAASLRVNRNGEELEQ